MRALLPPQSTTRSRSEKNSGTDFWATENTAVVSRRDALIWIIDPSLSHSYSFTTSTNILRRYLSAVSPLFLAQSSKSAPILHSILLKSKLVLTPLRQSRLENLLLMLTGTL